MKTWTPRWLLAILLLTVALPAWAQTPGVWEEIPNSSVVPLIPLGCGGNDIPAAVITAWVDGDYHPPSKSFVIPRGGGHGDNCFNGGVAFSTETRTWRRTTDRGQYPVMIPSTPDSAFINPYNNEPQSVHSYGAVATMPNGKLWTAGGIYWSRPGESDQKTWWYDPTKTTVPTAYERKANRPGGYGTYAALDPSDGSILLRISSGFWRYTPTTDSYAKLFDQSFSGGSSSLALDVTERKVYRINQHSAAPWGIRMIDLNNLAAKEILLATEGDTQIETIYGSGLFFDAGKLIGFGPGPTSATGAMYTLDPRNCGLGGQPACRWTRYVPPSGPNPPRGTPNGIWKKWFKGHDGAYWAIVHGGNVWRISLGAAPPTQHTLTITKTGSGEGTFSGQGTYPTGTVVALQGTPAAGSTGPVWTGDPDCADASVTMTTSKACVATYTLIPDTTPPVLSITSPKEQQLIKVITPLTYTVTDNQPGEISTTVLLDGVVFTAQDLDPAVLPEGVHQLIVRSVDQAGNSTQQTLNVVSVQCPVCVASYPLTLQTAGTGSGTVTGAGDYIPNAVVTLGNIPTTGSEFKGWSPVPCAPSFPMPASALACLATFDLKPVAQYPLTITTAGTGTGSVTGAGTYPVNTVVVLGGAPASGSTGPVWSGDADCTDASVTMTGPRACVATYTTSGPPSAIFPPNQWVLRPEKPAGTTTTRAGKHARLTHDGIGFVIGGGDRYGNDNGQPAVERIDPVTGASTLLSPMCPAAPLLMPNFPDNVVWVLDAAQKRMIMQTGFYNRAPWDLYPSGTLTPSATTGTITLSSSVAAFEPWMIGKTVSQINPTSYATLAKATLVEPFISPTVANATVTLTFPATTAIPAKSWRLDDVLSGEAARNCKRNLFAGDTGVQNTDVIFNLTTNKYEAKPWPTGPMGEGSDGSGPSFGVLDPASRVLWTAKKDGAWGANLLGLNLDTYAWERVKMGANLTGGSWQRDAVKNANIYRSQLQLVAGTIYMISSRGAPKPPATWVSGTSTGSSLVMVPLNDLTRGRAISLPPGYAGQPDDVESCLIHDPKANILYHPFHASLTGPITHLYIFDLATEQWLIRPWDQTGEQPMGGSCAWDPLHEGLRIWGRRVGTTPGYFMWGYRYQKAN